MNNENILTLLSDFCNDDTDIEKLDLTTEEDYSKFKNYVKECREMAEENALFTSFMNIFGGFNMSDLLDEIEEIGEKIHNDARKDMIDLPELPSKNTPLDIQEKMHKIVGEYVDKYIRPYGNMSTEVIDDAYAGLFEFACWVMNR